jgi:transposase
VELRFLAVESSTLAESFEAGLASRLASDRKRCETAMKKLGARQFECEGDAASALQQVLDERRLHRVTADVVPEVLTLPRRRGRPRLGEAPPTKLIYRVVLRSVEVDADAVEHARCHARFFVLATDHLDRQLWPDSRILAEYRHQYAIEGHTGFRWLKGPAAIAPMFLKTPRRIAALGLVFVLALMVRNWIQFTLRRKLAEADDTIPNMNNQPTTKPTTEVAFWHFLTVSTVLVVVDGRVVQRVLGGMNEHTEKILRLLGIPASVFTTPRKNPALAGTRSQE